MLAAVYAVIVIASAIMLSANHKFDVVANHAADSFKSLGEEIGLSGHGGPLYEVFSPDGTEIFSYGESVRLTVDIGWFKAAGFDPEKFGGEAAADDSRLTIISNQVKGVDIAYVNARGAFDVFETVLRSNRHALEYHMDHDLFELHLGRGNTFRWAKDWRTNTRGMTFVLNPRPFIEAGLDPENLAGWSFANVNIMYGPKKGQTVPRLLKNYSYCGTIKKEVFDMEKTIIKVEGMSCEHCVGAVTRAVTALPGIGGVAVELKTGTVTVEHDPGITNAIKIKAEIEDQGYDVVE